MMFEEHSGDMSGSDIDSDECNQRVFQVLPAEEGEDLSAPPMTGEQFLRRVIEESRRCEKIPVANLKELRDKQAKNQVLKFPEAKKCNDEFKLDREGQLGSLKDFTLLREQIEAKRTQMADTKTFIELQKSVPMKEDESEWLEFCTELCPDKKTPKNLSTVICIAIPQVKVWSLLCYMAEWIEEKQLSVMEGCRWVYCLLACLEVPVEAEVHYNLRRFARVIIHYRSQMESPDPELLPHLNLLICIIGRYFDQRDLADPF